MYNSTNVVKTLFMRNFAVVYKELIASCFAASSWNYMLQVQPTDLGILLGWFVMWLGPCHYRKEQFLKQREVRIALSSIFAWSLQLPVVSES
jgi:hypothetical protein